MSIILPDEWIRILKKATRFTWAQAATWDDNNETSTKTDKCRDGFVSYVTLTGVFNDCVGSVLRTFQVKSTGHSTANALTQQTTRPQTANPVMCRTEFTDFSLPHVTKFYAAPVIQSRLRLQKFTALPQTTCTILPRHSQLLSCMTCEISYRTSPTSG